MRFENTQAQIGADPDSFTELLNTSAWLAIPELFATATPAGQEGSRHTLFYAESWIVMHYLLSQNKLPETGTYFDLIENQHLSVDEAILRFHHQLTKIHPFANGNGRHARMIADVVAVKSGAGELMVGIRGCGAFSVVMGPPFRSVACEFTREAR